MVTSGLGGDPSHAAAGGPPARGAFGRNGFPRPGDLGARLDGDGAQQPQHAWPDPHQARLILAAHWRGTNRAAPASPHHRAWPQLLGRTVRTAAVCIREEPINGLQGRWGLAHAF